MNDKRDFGFQIIAERSVWERKQRLYYQMRHDGLRRLNKPGAWAADQHLPLVDMTITDLKPFWSAQVFGGERVCDFVAMREQLQEVTAAAAEYHDFELRHFSNYRLAMERTLDTMLLRGRGVLLATTEPTDNHALVFRSIDPQCILMGQDHDDFDDADEWIYVQALTVAQYKANPHYNQEAAVLRAIRGRKDFNFNSIEIEKQLREGVTHSFRDNQIILWHHWQKCPDGWIITVFSPQATDIPIRPQYKCPYKVAKKASCPFFSFSMEVKDEGWYSPRGVAELSAAFEAYACTLWNHKTDAMKFGNTPLFTSDKEIPNSSNIRFNPGELIPGNIKAVEMPQPAISFDQEINFARGISEQRTKVPDFGIEQQGSMGNGGNPRTATENNRIAGLQNVGADYNGEVFRGTRLQKLYRHTWGLMLQFQRTRLSYFVGNELKTLPQQALHDEYLVIPTGGPANKLEKLNRAGTRYQLFLGKPNINQDELAKDVLSADDARLVKRLLIPGDAKQQSESYQEAVDIGVMMIGYHAPVLPNQDHPTRIMVLLGYLQKQEQTGAPIEPVAMQRLQQHLAQHIEMLKQTQPDVAKQVIAQIQQLEQQAMQAKQPQNMVAGPGAEPQPQPAMAGV